MNTWERIRWGLRVVPSDQSIAFRVLMAIVGHTDAKVAVPASVGSGGGNHATGSVGTAQVGGGNTASHSIGTVQVSSVSARPSVRVHSAATSAYAAVPAAVGPGTNRTTGSVGTAQVGGGNRSSNSVGTVQVSHVRVGPFASVAVACLRALLGTELAIGGSGGKSAAGSIGSVQLGGGNGAENSIGTVQIGSTAARVVSAAAGAVVRAVVLVGGSGNGVSHSVGTAQLGGGNSATDSIGTVQAGGPAAGSSVTVATPAGPATVSLPGSVGGSGGNTSSGSVGTVQVGGGNTASGSTGTVQVGSGSGSRRGGSGPATPPLGHRPTTVPRTPAAAGKPKAKSTFQPPNGAAGSGITHLSSLPATLPFTGVDLVRWLVAGLAALLSVVVQPPSRARVGVILSGGNVDPARFCRLLNSISS